MGVESEEFAAMLRELKERSGRSYGALATRLHVSTSTLHRYCNGAAVPTEYAPVERLARACGAGDKELVELHRRWILAVAARRREASSAGTANASPMTDTAAAQLEPQPAPDPQSAAVPEEEEVKTVHPASLPAEPRRRARTRVLLSATAVLAAAVSVFVLRDAGGTPNPSASTPSAPAPPEVVPAPFHVSVLTDNWGSVCDQWFLSARTPAQVTPPPPPSGRIDSWAAAQRAVPAGHLRLQLTAQGASATPVVLHAMYVQVVSTQPAPKWNAYTPGAGCGGELGPASFAVDFDAAGPHAVPVPGWEGARKTAPTNFPYRVSDSDPQVINVDATTRSQDVSWFLELVWTSGDRQGTLRVDDRGRPFRTAGLHGAPSYFHNGTSWAPASAEY
ncbi:helix-turn-helix domain-containing protein [Microtetraspora malaysiensis]|uniref:helix-turn-helix domain-containing protein n=1 Tax=Microtetraspora malaysiensis TaxID=161358 RepID=UPI003D8A9D75